MKRTFVQGVLQNGLRPLFCALLFVLSASVAFSQENAGSIQGVIKDESGAVIVGARVTVTSPELVRSIETVTDNAGVYIFPKLPVGTYSVTATSTGFKTVKKEGIAVQLGSELKLDIALPAGNVAEEVTITASEQAIDVSSSKTQTNISELRIDQTAKGRTFNSVLQLAPGVRPEPKAGTAGVGGYQVDGASGSENVFIIDGVEVSNIRNASLGRESAIPFEFIREVQVKSAGFEAEYGGATGGVVNVVTQSGSNAFHGEGALMFTGAALNTAPRGTWRRNPANANAAQFFQAKEDEYRTFYPGFRFGGPILRERLNFFTSYFPELTRTERSTLFVGETASRTSTQRVVRHYGMARADYAPTQKIQINSSYFWTPTRIAGALVSSDPQGAKPTNDLTKIGGFIPAQAATGAVTYTPTSRLILSGRYGYKYLNDKGSNYGIPSDPYLVYSTPTAQQTSPAVPAQFAGPVNFTNVSSTFKVLRDITTRHNVYLDGSYIVRIAGQQHSFKGGYSINRIANDVNSDYTNGRFNFFWGEGFTRGGDSPIKNVRGTYGYYVWQDGVRLNSKVSSRNQGFYFQDSWQVAPRLTLNLGMRFEDEFLPPYQQEAGGRKIANPISFGWGDKIAPRLGAAWDVRGDGKWKISGSYGHFFDTMKYELARGSFGGDFWHDRVYKLDDPDIKKVSKANPGALGALVIDIDHRTVPINAQGEIDGVDVDIKPYESREFTVTSEHQLGANFVASVRYTKKHLVRTIEDIGILNSEGSEVYTIGNPGFDSLAKAKGNAPSGDPIVPRAKREYDGVEFRVDQRLTSYLNYSASYTYSRLFGNYAGLANSDENGRSDPNVSRAFDLFYSNFDSHGRNVYGRLATDRPHSFKFFGNYDLSTRAGITRFSLSQYAYSGTPLSSEVSVIVPVFYNGRGDLGRTDPFTQTDILVGHTIKLSEGVSLRFDANILNLFNQANEINRTVRLNRNGTLSFSEADFLKGFDATKLVYAPGTINPATGSPFSSPILNPIFNLPLSFQGGREIRLGMHLFF